MTDRKRPSGRPSLPRKRRGGGPRSQAAAPAEPAADVRTTGGQAVAKQPGERSDRRVRRPRLTGRAAILILVLAVLTVSYASSMRAYLTQRAQINQLQAEISERQASIDSLEREKKRWKDSAYVEQQARERFGYVYPGETSFEVIGEDGKPLDPDATLSDPDSVANPVPKPWWETAWASVETAGEPGKHRAPADTIP